VNGAIGRTNLPRKAENQEEEEEPLFSGRRLIRRLGGLLSQSSGESVGHNPRDQIKQNSTICRRSVEGSWKRLYPKNPIA